MLIPHPEPATYAHTLWRHTATKTDYTILGFAIEERTLIPVVVYQQFSGEKSPVWTRPAAEFFDGRFVEINTAKRFLDDPNFQTIRGETGATET